jgi:hypothetical protein
MGKWFEKGGISIEANTHGILFNPISIGKYFNLISESVSPRVVEVNNRWVSLDHHGSIGAASEHELLALLKDLNTKARMALQQADVVLITLGTAHVWKWRIDDQTVANCHKMPQSEFEKELLSVDEMVASLVDLVKKLPDKQVILTLSPVRYTRDTLVGNARSKARLLESIHQVCESMSNAHYFPAYEIVIDELRDYRFFKEDMIHPSESAIHHVFERFVSSTCDEQSIAAWHQIEKLNKVFDHIPLHDDAQHEKAKQEAAQRIQRIVDAEKKRNDSH